MLERQTAAHAGNAKVKIRKVSLVGRREGDSLARLLPIVQQPSRTAKRRGSCALRDRSSDNWGNFNANWRVMMCFLVI